MSEVLVESLVSDKDEEVKVENTEILNTSEGVSEDLGEESAEEDDFDLEALLGLTDEDLESSKGNVEVVSDDNISVEEPHIKIPTKKLEDILRISAVLGANGNSLDSKCIYMKIKGDNIHFYMTDSFMNNVEKVVDIMNEKNRFEGTLVFSTSTLARLSRVCSTIFTLVERQVEGSEEKKYFIKVIGGEIPIDTIKNIPESGFVVDFEDSTKKSFDKSEFTDHIKRLYPYANGAVKDSKYIEFNGNTVQAYHMGSAVRISSNSSYGNFAMSLPSARVLFLLCSGDVGGDIKINDDGTIFSGLNYNLKMSKLNITGCAYSSIIDRMFLGESVVADVPHLNKLTDLSCGLEYSSGSMSFNYTSLGMVQCDVLTKRGNSKIELRGTANPNVTALENSVEIVSSNLKNVLSVYPQDLTVNMRVSSDGISTESGGVKAIIIGKGVGK